MAFHWNARIEKESKPSLMGTGSAAGLMAATAPAEAVCRNVRLRIGNVVSRFGKRHSREAYHAPRIDVPLLVAQQFAARSGQRFQKSIERRGTAPFQIVVVLPHQAPEAVSIRFHDARDALAVALGNLRHDAPV